MTPQAFGPLPAGGESPWCTSTTWLFTPSRSNALDVRLIADTSSPNRQLLDPVGDDDVGQVLQRGADDRDRHPAGADDLERQQGRQPRALQVDVGTEHREVRALERVRGTGSRRPGGSHRAAAAAARRNPRPARGCPGPSPVRRARSAPRQWARRGTGRTPAATRRCCRRWTPPREFLTSARSCLTWVARYAAPPASTVVPSACTTRPDDPVGGSRLPCRSLKLITRTWTDFGVGFGCLPPCASAPVAPSDPKVNATTAITAARRNQVRLESSPHPTTPSPQTAVPAKSHRYRPRWVDLRREQRDTSAPERELVARGCSRLRRRRRPRMADYGPPIGAERRRRSAGPVHTSRTTCSVDRPPVRKR